MVYTTSVDSFDVNKILDDGASGLLYFEKYLQLCLEAVKTTGPTYEAMAAKYDMQRGMDLEALRRVSAGLKDALEAADSEWELQNSQLQILPSVWQGGAANAAITMMGDQVKRADEDRGQVRFALSAIDAAVLSIRSVIVTKAKTVDSFWDDANQGRIDGKTPSDVYDIVQAARSGASEDWGTNPFDSDQRIDHLRRIFPGVSDDDMPRKCWEWVREIFYPDVKKKVDLFDGACNKAHQSIATLYGAITTALAKLDDDPYPRPAVPTSPGNNPGPAPGPSTPGPSTPGPSTPGPSTTPATTTDPSTTTTPFTTSLESLTGLASTLTSLASTAAQSISEGLSALAEPIKEGIDGALGNILEAEDAKEEPQDAEEGDGKPGDKAAEFDLAGKHLKFEMGSDGQLKLVVTDDDGTLKEFTVKIDENGAPVISMNGSGPEDDQRSGGEESDPDAEPSTGAVDDQAHAPDPGSAPGEGPGQPVVAPGKPPTGKREEDGEHHPGIARVDPPEEPFDSGAQLAEAGPL
ncbi:hypothetical protein ABZV58_11505 [Nocardia sp. NPDC004654]|uniref:hypothetical protein n=1 Tax=Nocardia sp. NPDC004654 TaxID=3154776 RepID=UPI0033AFE71C